ncbi:MAG: glycosyl hydrolase-related protein [Actinomyces sp.]|jgi:alpha-mannosidase|nr:glycoside hydrolase family 38 C-terminal domain-containing protein [Actinomyces sp.]MCI1787383.1 glycosyl hydrolase-related protein [Actinomyces sp.]MCI1830799.1 glycosyl hydrolase-related protein [Actinomyces sp.]
MNESHARLTVDRIDRLVHDRIVPAVNAHAIPVDVLRWDAPGEPVAFAEAVRADYRPSEPGEAWGAPWSTTWFRLETTVPATWRAEDGLVEFAVDLGFTRANPGFQAEGTAWDADGRIIKGIQPRNAHVPVRAIAGQRVVVYVEAAGNPDLARSGAESFLPTGLGRRETAGSACQYRRGDFLLTQRDETVWSLLQDLRALRGLVDVLPADRPRRSRVLEAMDAMLALVDPHDVGSTAEAGRSALRPALASPAAASAHAVVATGHAHIDSAWLWPLRETRRKVARTYSNVLSLMEEYPDLVYACPAAQHLSWIESDYPELFARVRAAVQEGRFVLVGGMWVESDTNMPSGESLVRQFVEGKQYMREKFGVETHEVWLPDSFGFSAAFPQIARQAGCGWFLSQKLSWNDTNRMPHHSFLWEGIDGSRVYAHFPPVDTYNSDLSAADLDRAERQFASPERANTSLVPFGYGDGGGGPTREMMEAARRTADLEGSPRVSVGTPAAFFTASEAADPRPPVWSGELYLELHRGVFTSQADTKRGNRRSEALLHEAELWAATACVRRGASYPYDRLADLWRTVLLGQFHDILPGSAIGWVYDEFKQKYAQIERDAEEITASALGSLCGVGDTGAPSVMASANSTPFPTAGVPAGGVGAAVPPASRTVAIEDAAGWTLDNGEVRVHVGRDGAIDSLVHVALGREVVPDGEKAGVPQLFRDNPAKWDAWDLDPIAAGTGRPLLGADAVWLDGGSAEPTVRAERTFGDSALSQSISLVPGRAQVDVSCDVDWHESEHLLKIAYPVDIRSDHFASEIQFGHLNRPLHTNTSWDEARFEMCAHRWVYIDEPGFGVGIVNDSTYGHDVTKADSGRAAVIRQSLLRAPKYPDPDADQGRHRFRTRIVVGEGLEDVIAAGYEVNCPPRPVKAAGPVEPLVRPENELGCAVLDTVKLAQDRSGDVILRVYEALGGRARIRLHIGEEIARAALTDLLEREERALDVEGDSVVLGLRPFQVATVRLSWRR